MQQNYAKYRVFGNCFLNENKQIRGSFSKCYAKSKYRRYKEVKCKKLLKFFEILFETDVSVCHGRKHEAFHLEFIQ